MRFLIIIVFALLFEGCSSEERNKLDCYNQFLMELKKTNIYGEVMNKAKQDLPLLKDINNRSFFYDSAYIDSALLDSAIFFNDKKDKCLLLVLQKTSQELNLDQIQIIQGTLYEREWKFSLDRLPEVPHITFTSNKEVSQASHNNSFNLLSDKGRRFILSAGTTDIIGCKIDNKYWFND
jgi:hypothetical protein